MRPGVDKGQGGAYLLLPPDYEGINAYSAVDDKFFSNSFFNLDIQAIFFMIAYSSAPYMNVNSPGLGARYPSTFKDADGDYLVGDRTYRLHLPPNVPAGLFWSLTAYSPVSGVMVDAGQAFPVDQFNEQSRRERGWVL